MQEWRRVWPLSSCQKECYAVSAGCHPVFSWTTYMPLKYYTIQ